MNPAELAIIRLEPDGSIKPSPASKRPKVPWLHRYFHTRLDRPRLLLLFLRHRTSINLVSDLPGASIAACR